MIITQTVFFVEIGKEIAFAHVVLMFIDKSIIFYYLHVFHDIYT